MDVDAGEMLAAKLHQFLPLPARFSQQPHGDEKKCPRTTRRIQQRSFRSFSFLARESCLAKREFSQPVGSVELAKIVPRLRIDQFLVKFLEKVFVDGVKVISGGQASGNGEEHVAGG